MKTFQNNFTTPEQSKRLLELGVPVDSADCYYTQEEIEGNMYWFDLHIKRQYQPHTSLHASTIWGETLPCWSVGRLIELHEILFPQYKNFIIERNDVTLISRMVKYYEIGAKQGALNFSKLDE